MRPAYRFALASLVALLAIGAVIGTLLLPRDQVPGAIPADQVRQPVRPAGIEPLAEPVVGTPTPAQQTEVLDQLEDLDARRLGATEALERRRIREHLLQKRIEEASE